MNNLDNHVYKAIVFDIDGTLTRSKLPIEKHLAEMLCLLTKYYLVGIISGAGFEQFKWQILDNLSCERESLKNLILMPADGTVFCNHNSSGWTYENDPPLSEEEKLSIRRAFEKVFDAAGLEKPEKIYGEQIEDRGAQLNFSAFGQDAPIDLKEAWDPDNKKREKLVAILKNSLPEFSLRIGGTTSIEITRKGIDKAYGLSKFMEKTGFLKSEILYFGDKLASGGNDNPVLSMGINCVAVNGPEDTEREISRLLDKF